MKYARLGYSRTYYGRNGIDHDAVRGSVRATIKSKKSRTATVGPPSSKRRVPGSSQRTLRRLIHELPG